MPPPEEVVHEALREALLGVKAPEQKVPQLKTTKGGRIEAIRS